jgi:Peptidase family M28
MVEIITIGDAQYALDIVTKICTEVGPGLPASPQERQRAGIIQKELETHLGAENVVMEAFTVAPDAVQSPFPTVLFMILAVLLNLAVPRLTGVSAWIASIAALVFAILTPVLFTLEFLLGHEVLDRFYRQKQSVNVIGSLRKPDATTIKRLFILSGHHDSAPENTWMRLLKYGFFVLSAIFFIGLITMLVVCLIQLVGLILGNPSVISAGTLGWGLLVFIILPAIIYMAFATRGKKGGGVVPGAVDNLSASAVTVAMCRFLVNNPDYIPEDTEIRFISFGSEEAGLRGSRRYVARHLEELKHLNAQVLNYEMIAHPLIPIMTSDINGTVKHSPQMVKSVEAAAQRAGVPYRVGPGYIGVITDAAPFTQAGLQAITLIPFKFPQQHVAFYHQKWDTPDKVTIEPLINVLKLTFEWIRNQG